MFKDMYEVEEVQASIGPAEHGLIDSQFIISGQFPVFSAYVETLPDGLIGDEI